MTHTDASLSKSGTPYTYIERSYGVSWMVGDHVYHEESGRYGTVQPPEVNGGTQYVRVRFDGDHFDMNSHPEALKLVVGSTGWRREAE